MYPILKHFQPLAKSYEEAVANRVTAARRHGRSIELVRVGRALQIRCIIAVSVARVS